MKPIEDMTPEEIDELRELLRQELIRRQNRALYQERQTELQQEFRVAGMLPTPTPEAEWSRPPESLLAYGVGDVVTDGKTRRRATAGMVICAPACEEHWTDAEEPTE